MAKDCPDRQRGTNWRNDAPGGMPGRPAGRIGGGDAVDREYEVNDFINLGFYTQLTFFSNSCKSFLAAALLVMVMLPSALKQDQVGTKMVGMTATEKEVGT